MNKSDSIFLKHFAQVIAGLFVLKLFLIGAAYYIHVQQPHSESSASVSQIAGRLAPVANVYAGDTGRQAITAAQEAAKAALAANVPFNGSTDGSVIYNGLCSACHNTGAGGAPKLEKALWAARVSQGADTLIKHATEGFTGAAGMMPARGGNPALTDEQVKVAVEWMVNNLK